MKLVDNVLKDPMKTGLVFGGSAAVAHFVFAADLMVTGGIGAVGVYFVWKALNKKG